MKLPELKDADTERASSKHHEELRFTIDGLDGPIDPFVTFDDSALRGAIERTLGNLLGGEHPLAALYLDDKNALLARINFTDVKFLHELRDSVLQGKFGNHLAAALGPLAAGTMEVKFDLTDFAQRYERSALFLKELTPHQKLKLAECKGHKSVRVEAPAGGGKTFIALHEMLDVLQQDGEDDEATQVLFVAPHAALAHFVASWIFQRLGELDLDLNFDEPQDVLARVYVLFPPFEQGKLRRCSMPDEGRVEFDPVDDAPTFFSLIVVDEVRAAPGQYPCQSTSHLNPLYRLTRRAITCTSSPQ